MTDIWRANAKEEKSYWVFLYIAGNINSIEMICREYVYMGLCVTVEPIKFIYTGGAEDGARIGFIQYARFPNTTGKIFDHAIELGKIIAERNYQCSFTVLDPYSSVYFSNKDKK